MEISHLKNWEIKASKVRLVGQEGGSQIVSLKNAIDMADSQDLDLIMVDSKPNPPVCKILDYGKFKYEQSKKGKPKKNKEDKEIRIRYVTNPKDLEVKIKHARELLLEGHRVIWTMRFRGKREPMFIETGKQLMRQVVDSLLDISKIEQDVKCDGSTVMAKVAPLPQARTN